MNNVELIIPGNNMSCEQELEYIVNADMGKKYQVQVLNNTGEYVYVIGTVVGIDEDYYYLKYTIDGVEKTSEWCHDVVLSGEVQ